MKFLFHSIIKKIDTKKGIILALFIVYFFVVVFTYIFVSSSAYGPFHQDEDRYWNMAYEIYKGTFNLLNNHQQPIFYPFSLLPAFILFYPTYTYEAVKFLNILFISSVIFPSYLILRTFTGRFISLLGAFIILLNPAQIVLPRVVLSENIYYPFFLWAILLAFSYLSPVKSKLRFIEDFLLGIILSILLLTRFITFGLIPALLIIWWLKPYHDEKPSPIVSLSKIKYSILVITPIILILGTWILFGIREGLSIQDLLGFSIANDSNPLQLTITRLIMWIIFYLSYVILLGSPVLGLLLISSKYIQWKYWQENLPRWFITIFLIVFFFILACVRHSWRAAYNFPDPNKLQGRYIFYLGPLFIITAIIALKRIKLPDLHSKDWGFWIYIITTSGIILIAYSILFKGLIFLKQPMQISINSPDGYFIQSLSNSFLPIVLFFNMFIAWIMGRKIQYSFTVLASLLCLFYIIGDISLFMNKEIPTQFYPIQAYHLIKAIQHEEKGLSDPETTPIIVGDEPGSPDTTLKARWKSTLYAYGYRNIEIFEDPRLSGQAEAYNFIKVGNQEYRVDGVNEADYISCNCEKYEFMGNYYTVRQNSHK